MPPLPPTNIGAIVADVDMTIIKDASSELSGLNLDLITEVLSQKIHVLLISGSPYDSEYCGVKTSASLHRRVVLPLSQSLGVNNKIQCLNFLKIFYASGRGTVSFDPTGKEIRNGDRTDKDIDPTLQSIVFKAFLCGFYALQKDPPQGQLSPLDFEKIWKTQGSDNHIAEFVRGTIKSELNRDVGPLEKWSFGSEMALVFHGIVSSGPLITKRAQEILKNENVPLPDDFFWAGGTDFAKVSRIRKRDMISSEIDSLKKEGKLNENKIILTFGDSNVDDFLSLYKEPHQSFFLGSRSDAANFPSAILTLDQQGNDRQEAKGFGVVLKNILTGA